MSLQAARQATGEAELLHLYVPQLAETSLQLPEPQVGVSTATALASHFVAPQSSPLGTAAQLPSEPAMLQRLHVLQLAEPQQTPSTQWAEAQALSLVPQADPLGSCATQTLLTQVKGGLQSLFPLHAVLQLVPALSQANPLQRLVLLLQPPLPSQALVSSEPLLQVVAPHDVVSSGNVQLPCPSQLPSQTLSVPVQSPRGSAPAPTSSQVPAMVPLQVRQVPAQADSQHTPSVHELLSHSDGAAQAAPLAFFFDAASASVPLSAPSEGGIAPSFAGSQLLLCRLQVRPEAHGVFSSQ
ncbi:MAG: hypothetical protein KC503_39640 [Myxococcales bacterium]|nr:hypothetical protein [Myxococcales bacterium]